MQDDRWIFQGIFKTALENYQGRTGKTQAEVAMEIGTTLGTLRGLIYSKTKRPSLDFLQRAASVFGCSVTDFIDDPGKMIAGREASKLSPKRRFFADLMFIKYSSDDLSDEDAELLYQDFVAADERLRALKARHAKT